MGQKKRLRRLEKAIRLIEFQLAQLLQVKGAEDGLSSKPALQGTGPTDNPGFHPDGSPHVISSIGRLPNEALYNCSCGAQFVVKGERYKNSEGYEGVRFPFNPFAPDMRKLPANWQLGEELKQLD